MKYRILFFMIVGLMLVGISGYAISFPSYDPNMILYYHFNNQSSYGESNTHVFDFSGSGNNGTISNAIWNSTGGVLGDGALEFNGASTWVNVSDSTVFSPYYNNNISSISVWFKIYQDDTGDGSNNRKYLFSKGNINNYEYSLYKVDTNYNNNIIFEEQESTGVYSDIIQFGNVSFNTWHNIVITANGTLKTGYMDGILITTRNNIRWNIAGNAEFRIGQRRNLGYFNGSLDDLIFYNKTLSSKEVFENYYRYFNCINPTNQLNILGNANFCNNNYFLNSSGNDFGSGAVVIKNSNIIIDGASSTFFGNSSGVAISGTGYTNVTIRNLNISNYNRGIFVQNGNDYNISNIYINNSDVVCILLRGITSSNISDAVCENSIGSGFSFDTYSSTKYATNNIIQNSRTYNTSIGISISTNSSNNSVLNNYINLTSSTNHGIYILDANYTTIYNNSVYNAGWNGLAIRSSYNNISSNIIDNPRHNGIDLYVGNYDMRKNNIIDKNIIRNMYGDIDYPITGAIGLSTSDGNNITNNIIINVGQGLGSVYNVTDSSSNFWLNNTVINATIGLTSRANDTYENNTVQSSSYGIVFNKVFGYNDESTFLNNVFNGLFLYNNTDPINMFNFSSFNLSEALLFSKNSVCNGSSSVVSSNNGNLNITINPSNECFIIDKFNLSSDMFTYDDYNVSFEYMVKDQNINIDTLYLFSDGKYTLTNMTVTTENIQFSNENHATLNLDSSSTISLTG